MRAIILSLLGGTAALAASAVQAAPIHATAPDVANNATEQVRLVCNEWGRCYRTRGPRVIVDGGYNSYDYYGPRYRYRPYGYYSSPGFSFNAPGVHVGVGAPGYW